MSGWGREVEEAAMEQRYEDEQQREWIDRSDPTWPRGVTQVHLDADDDHEPVPYSAYNDNLSDQCDTCGLATTSDGKRHGWDAS